MRAPSTTIRNARALRRRMSAPEARLWKHLRIRLPDAPVFRRQHPIGPYILDFYCAGSRLAIEVDGAIHDVRQERDQTRDAWLREHGMTVIRISAVDLTRRFDDCVDGIFRMAYDLQHRDAPSTMLRMVPLPRSRVGG